MVSNGSPTSASVHGDVYDIRGLKLKAVLRRLFARSLARLDLHEVLRRRVGVTRSILTVDDDAIDLHQIERIIVVAIGKAAGPMTASVAKLLAPRTFDGIIVSTNAPTTPIPGCEYYLGGHPLPNVRSFDAGAAVMNCLQQLGSRDLVIYLLSGGGSALFEQPIDGLNLDDTQALYRLLVTGGPTIADINTIRKHLSRVKGGQLTALAGQAKQLTFYVSDVPDDDPSLIASGPTMPDPSTVADCQTIINRARLFNQMPIAVRKLFENNRVPETPKPGSPEFATSRWYRLLGSTEAAKTMADEVQAFGWHVMIDNAVRDNWPLERTVEHLLTMVDHVRQAHSQRPVAIVNGGEFSCPVTNPLGLGGRNQAFVLACVPRIAGHSMAVLSAGTDGIDGSSPAAGAVADGESLSRVERSGLDHDTYLRRADAHRFFDPLGDTITTGPTGHNVRDLRLLVAW